MIKHIRHKVLWASLLLQPLISCLELNLLNSKSQIQLAGLISNHSFFNLCVDLNASKKLKKSNFLNLKSCEDFRNFQQWDYDLGSERITLKSNSSYCWAGPNTSKKSSKSQLKLIDWSLKNLSDSRY